MPKTFCKPCVIFVIGSFIGISELYLHFIPCKPVRKQWQVKVQKAQKDYIPFKKPFQANFKFVTDRRKVYSL